MKEEEEKSDLINNSSKGSKDQENQIEELKIDKVRYKIERNIKTPNYDKSIKVILLGDSMVGKSSIINRLCNATFDENINATIAIEYYNYCIKVNDFIVRLQIWDTCGQEKFNSIVKNYYQNTDYGIFVYSIDNLESFMKIKEWLAYTLDNNAKTENNQMKNILLENKKDLGDNVRKVSYYDGESFSKNNDFFIFKEISCKDADEKEKNNFLEIFDEIAKNCYDNHVARRSSTVDSDSLNYVASKTMMEMSLKAKPKKTIKKKKNCC